MHVCRQIAIDYSWSYKNSKSTASLKKTPGTCGFVFEKHLEKLYSQLSQMCMWQVLSFRLLHYIVLLTLLYAWGNRGVAAEMICPRLPVTDRCRSQSS